MSNLNLQKQYERIRRLGYLVSVNYLYNKYLISEIYNFDEDICVVLLDKNKRCIFISEVDTAEDSE